MQRCLSCWQGRYDYGRWTPCVGFYDLSKTQNSGKCDMCARLSTLYSVKWNTLPPVFSLAFVKNDESSSSTKTPLCCEACDAHIKRVFETTGKDTIITFDQSFRDRTRCCLCTARLEPPAKETVNGGIDKAMPPPSTTTITTTTTTSSSSVMPASEARKRALEQYKEAAAELDKVVAAVIDKAVGEGRMEIDRLEIAVPAKFKALASHLIREAQERYTALGYTKVIVAKGEDLSDGHMTLTISLAW